MKKTLLFGQVLSFLISIVQAKRDKNVFKDMNDSHAILYLLGTLLSTIAVIAAYLSSEKN